MFAGGAGGKPGGVATVPGLVWKEWWCNFVSGIMMPKFLPAVKSAARFFPRG
jgi:hypothetical protein